MEKEQARERILKTAFECFHRNGVHATGLDEVLSKSGTGKGQFYHYFKNKDDLIHQVLMMFFNNLKSGRIPLKLELESWADLENWFTFFVEYQRARGCERNCPVATIAAELNASQESLRADACAIFDYARAPLIRFFDAMRKKGDLPRGCNSEALADFCYTIMQGGLLVSKIRRDAAPFENSVRHALAYIRSLRKK